MVPKMAKLQLNPYRSVTYPMTTAPSPQLMAAHMRIVPYMERWLEDACKKSRVWASKTPLDRNNDSDTTQARIFPNVSTMGKAKDNKHSVEQSLQKTYTFFRRRV